MTRKLFDILSQVVGELQRGESVCLVLDDNAN